MLRYRLVCVTITLTLLGALVLIGALAMGWNSPRPSRPPAGRAFGRLPRDLAARPGEIVVSLLDIPGGARGPDAATNLTVEMIASAPDASEHDFNGYGLVYRAQDTGDYDVFAVGSDGYYAVLRVVDGEPVPLVDWRQFPHVRRGAGPNRLRLDCDGSACRFYVNDEYATTVENETWPDGQMGLWVWSPGDRPTLARFKTLRIWR